MVTYKFLNKNGKYSQYLTDSFVNAEDTSLKQFFVTAIMDRDEEIVSAGVDFSVDGYNEGTFIEAATKSQLKLEKNDGETTTVLVDFPDED